MIGCASRLTDRARPISVTPVKEKAPADKTTPEQAGGGNMTLSRAAN
jgi:hypothetical protein